MEEEEEGGLGLHGWSGFYELESVAVNGRNCVEMGRKNPEVIPKWR